MQNKRGMGEQFNWIFVVVSGAIILGFFTMFAFRYIDLEEHKQDLASIRDFGNVLNALGKLSVGDKGASIDSNNPEEGLRFGYKLNFNYECNEDKARIYINDGLFASYEFTDGVLFSENNNNVNALDLVIKPWKFPFHVTNIIYLSDTAKKYYFVYDSYSKEFVDNFEIGDAINVEMVKIDELKADKNSKIVFFLQKAPSEEKIESLKEDISDVEFLYIDLGKKEVSFYNSGWEDGISYYGSDELMTGAIFSSYDNYECSLGRAFAKLNDTGNVVVERTNVLNQISRKGNCRYNDIADNIRSFIAGEYNLKDKIEEINKAGSGCLWLF